MPRPLKHAEKASRLLKRAQFELALAEENGELYTTPSVERVAARVNVRSAIAIIEDGLDDVGRYA